MSEATSETVSCLFCGRTAVVVDADDPGLNGWISLYVWDGEDQVHFAWCCSIECLRESLTELQEHLGARFRRTAVDPDAPGLIDWLDVAVLMGRPKKRSIGSTRSLCGRGMCGVGRGLSWGADAGTSPPCGGIGCAANS